MFSPAAAGRRIFKLAITNGAPRRGAPFFFLALGLGLILTRTAAALPEPAGNTHTSERVVVTADTLVYHEAEGLITGDGHVHLWYGSMTLTAAAAEADLEQRVVKASGDVVLNESGREVHCARLTYDLASSSAQAEGILFAYPPWFYQGTRIEKRGPKDVLIAQPDFTTCNARRPHYHLTASRIEIILGESITAYDTVFYIGTTPLFYWPWFWRSLNDHRPPFTFQVGYNNTEGVYVKTKFNYYLLDQNFGDVRVDYFEKSGWGLGLDDHFHYAAAGKGDGDVSTYYLRDHLRGEDRWTLDLSDRHEFGPADLLQINLDYLSDTHWGEDFYDFSTDTYQQKSYVAYSHRAAQYYLSATLQDTETMDPVAMQYYSSSRQLPQLGFTLSPLRVWNDPRIPVYFNLTGDLVRNWVRLTDYPFLGLDASGNSLTGTDVNYRFEDRFDLTPGLTQTYVAPLWVPTQPSLSWTLSLPSSGYSKETLFDVHSQDALEPAELLDSTYNATVTLTDKWVNYTKTKPTELVQSRWSYTFARKFTHLDQSETVNNGISTDLVGLGLDYFAGSVFSLQSDTGYNRLPLSADASTDWRQRLLPLTVNGRAIVGPSFQTTWQAQYQWLLGKVTTGYLSANTLGKNWTLGVNGNYSYVGPLSYSPAPTDYREATIYGGLNATYRPLPTVSLQSQVQYDFSRDRLNQITFGIGYDLHCWEMQISYVRYFAADGNRDEIGLGINLKAFPELKAGMPGLGGMTLGQ